MIKQFLNSKSKSITSAAVVISIASLTSRFLGVVRDRILAGEFGAGDTLDIYYAAFRVPDLIYNLVVLGALSAGFIPVFTSLLKKEESEKYKDNKQAWELVSLVLNILIIFLVAVCATAIIFTKDLVPVITPGFSFEKMDLTVGLTRIMFLSPVFLAISGIFGGILQSFKRFLLFSLAPILYNVGIIVGAIFFVPIWGIYGLAWGVVLGAFLHMVIQVPTAYKLGYRYSLNLKIKNKNFKKILKMMLPRTLGLATVQVNLIVFTIIASLLATGSLAVFNLANNLQSFPIGIFGISFAIAAFPTLSLLASRGQKKQFIENLSNTTKQILFFIIPFSVLLIILRAQIVRIIFGTGEFDWTATVNTADTLGYFSISLFAQALFPLFARAFYAVQNTMIPFLSALISALVNFILSVLLAEKMGVAGMALAFSVSSVLNFCMLWVILRARLGYLNEFSVIKSAFKTTLATIAMAVTIQSFKFIVAPLVDMQTFLGILLQTMISAGAGAIAFILISLLLKSQEMLQFKNSIKKKIFKKSKPPQDSLRESGGL